MNEIVLALAQTGYLFFPLLFVALCSGIIMRGNLLTALKKPIDGGRRVRGRRLFGDNKTWRGVAAAITGGWLGVAVQKHVIGAGAGGLLLIDYEQTSVFWLGLAFGLGAVLGELPNSFVKRQLHVQPGSLAPGRRAALFYVVDQIDVVPSTWAFLLFWLWPSPMQLVASFVVVFVVHQIVSLVGFCIGARARLT
jgi:CDP-2,3-bis-(O-geranylgeranyl)-sn-glycerol synthase